MTEKINELTEAAEAGDIEAQNELGNCYYNGDGVEQDYKKAAYWYGKSAESGNAIPEYNLGLLYEYGDGVEQDSAKAAEWYRKSAEQGYERAQYKIGYCYYTGNGVEQDYEQAYDWFFEGSENGDAMAHYMLGWFCEKGYVVDKDEEKAFGLYSEAYEWGAVIAAKELGFCYYYGRGVQKDCAKALSYFEVAAEAGYCVAQTMLGLMYYDGTGTDINHEQAFAWFEKAATAGYGIAEYWMGRCYFEGKGVSRDYSLAKEWYTKAIKRGAEGSEDAKNGLQLVLDFEKMMETKGLCKDCAFATKRGKSYTCGKHEESVTATATCAYFTEKSDVENICRYAAGLLEHEKFEEGERLARLVAEQDYVPAKTLLGMYLICKKKTGDLEKNYSEGKYWLILAEAQGDEHAKKMLDDLGVDRKAGVKKKSTGKKKSVSKDKIKAEKLELEEASLQKALEKQNEKLKARYREEKWSFFKISLIIFAICAVASAILVYLCPVLLDELGIIDSRKMDLIYEKVEKNYGVFVACVTVVLTVISCRICKKMRGKTHTKEGYIEEDVLEVLVERLRINRLEQKALLEGRSLSEQEKQIYLTFVDTPEKICKNCVYCGESYTKTTYTDGSEYTTHNYYFCEKRNKVKVISQNTCDYFYPTRVAKAINEANTMCATISEHITSGFH